MENNKIYKKLLQKDFSEEIKMNIKDKLLNLEFNVCGRGIYDINNNPRKTSKRYYLEVDINGSEEITLIAILMNPSYTYPDTGFDRTIQNLIILAKKEEYKKLIVLNSFPDIESDSGKANKKYIEDLDNENFIELLLKNYNTSFDIFPACGDLVPHERYIKYVCKIANCKNNNKKDIWSFAPLTNKGRPRHLSQQAGYNIKLFNEYRTNQREKQYLQVVSALGKKSK